MFFFSSIFLVPVVPAEVKIEVVGYFWGGTTFGTTGTSGTTDFVSQFTTVRPALGWNKLFPEVVPPF